MASENNRWLQQTLAPTLKQRDFKKSGATWRKDNGEAVSVFNLQGSQWGQAFYINLGVYFRRLGDRDQPAEYDCHVRARLDDVVPRQDRDRLITLLDFEKPIEEAVRSRELQMLVVQHALTWLETVSTIEGARRYCDSQSPRSPWISRQARKFLSAEHPIPSDWP